MEAPTSTDYLMPRARRRPVAAAGAGLRPPAAAFEVRLEHGHLTIVEEDARENPAIPGQLRSGASPAIVKAICFSSLPLAMMPLTTLPLATLPPATMPLTTLPPATLPALARRQ